MNSHYIEEGNTESTMTSKGQHVVPRGNAWGVQTSGAKRVAKLYPTQQEAISHARERARRDGTELYIHGRDGKIRERSSFGNDPYPPKG
jgi:hypothetical protein